MCIRDRRSIVVLAKEKFGIRGRSMSDLNIEFIPFTAKSRMSGVNYNGNEIRKGAADAIQEYVACLLYTSTCR